MINKLSGAMLAALVLATPVLATEVAQPTRPPGGSSYVNNGPALNAAAVASLPTTQAAPRPCLGCTWGPPVTNGPAVNGVAPHLIVPDTAAAERPTGGGGFINNSPRLNALIAVAPAIVHGDVAASADAPKPATAGALLADGRHGGYTGGDWMINSPHLNGVRPRLTAPRDIASLATIPVHYDTGYGNRTTVR